MARTSISFLAILAISTLFACSPSAGLVRINELLEQERWQELASESRSFLEQPLGPDSAHLASIYRFSYLIGSAGQVFEGTLSHDELRAVARELTYKNLTTSYFKIRNARGANFNFISPSEDPFQLVATSSNANGTTILCWTYARFDKANLADENNDRTAALSGVVQSIDVNPNNSTFWILRIHLKDSNILFMN